MQADNEYMKVLNYLYEKSLMLHDRSSFNKTLYFFFIDALAHIDYTASIYAYHYESPKNIMGGEYLRWRIEEESKGDRIKFKGFINWLKESHPQKFTDLPSLWQIIYDTENHASYRSFRIVPDPNSKISIPADFFTAVIDEFFDQGFLKSLYEGNSLSILFETYAISH